MCVISCIVMIGSSVFVLALGVWLGVLFILPSRGGLWCEDTADLRTRGGDIYKVWSEKGEVETESCLDVRSIESFHITPSNVVEKSNHTRMVN